MSRALNNDRAVIRYRSEHKCHLKFCALSESTNLKLPGRLDTLFHLPLDSSVKMRIYELQVEMKDDDAVLSIVVPLRPTHTFVEQ